MPGNERWTPGPWRAVLDAKDQPQALYHGIVALVEHSGDREYKAVISEVTDYVSAEAWGANTVLIAAAPSLAAACEDALGYLRFYGGRDIAQAVDHQKLVDVLKAALGRARGEP